MQVTRGRHERGVAVGDPAVAHRPARVRPGHLVGIGQRAAAARAARRVEDRVGLPALDVHPQGRYLLDPRGLGRRVGDEPHRVRDVDLLRRAAEVVDHVVEDEELARRVAPAVPARGVDVRLLLTGGERRLLRDEPDGVVQVDLGDRRRLAVGGVHQAGPEADDPAVDVRPLALQVDADEVLAGPDRHRAEAVGELLGAGRHPRLTHGDRRGGRGVRRRGLRRRGGRRGCERDQQPRQRGRDQPQGTPRAHSLSSVVRRRWGVMNASGTLLPSSRLTVAILRPSCTA